MSAQHTPGPWEADTHSTADVAVVWAEADDRTPIASARDYDDLRPVAECQANARLIAAAPDLLAALKRFVEAYEGWPDSLFSSSGLSRRNEAIAAIAKAEGRS